MTFADRVRRAAKGLKDFGAGELADAMEIRTYRERQQIREAIRDFLKRGEMERIERGRYRYLPRIEKVTNRQRLWNVVRRMSGPFFTLNDLEQLTGIHRESIKEFCGWLVREGYAERLKKGHFRRTGNYGIEVPKDQKKVDRLVDWRRRIKEIERAARVLAEEMGGRIDDPGPETPVNRAKCEKLARLRRMRQCEPGSG